MFCPVLLFTQKNIFTSQEKSFGTGIQKYFVSDAQLFEMCSPSPALPLEMGYFSLEFEWHFYSFFCLSPCFLPLILTISSKVQLKITIYWSYYHCQVFFRERSSRNLIFLKYQSIGFRLLRRHKEPNFLLNLGSRWLN